MKSNMNGFLKAFVFMVTAVVLILASGLPAYSVSN